MIDFSVKGSAELQATLQKMLGDMQATAGDALRAEAEIEMTEAKRRTPVKTGALRGSGNVLGPVPDRGGVYVKLGFGGPAGRGNVGGDTNNVDVGYALEVHENVEAFHRVGQAKFLESVILESAKYMPDRVAKRIAARILKGKG